jgi:hypothetical protein
VKRNLRRQTDIPDCCLDLLSIRSANHKDLLHACQCKTFEGPVEESSIADRQQTLEQCETDGAYGAIGHQRTLGLPRVKGLKRLLKLSARMTAWRTSSSPAKSFSLPFCFGGMV